MSRPISASINVSHLIENYHLLKKQTTAPQLMAVIKANAYGHDIKIVAEALAGAGCDHFAVTDTDEGAYLREILTQQKRGGSITLFSGIFDAVDAEMCWRYALTPAVTTPEQLMWLAAADKGAEEQAQKVWLKVDTGMQRLGTEHLHSLFQLANTQGIEVVGVMSHLACADDINNSINNTQINLFKDKVKVLPDNISRSLLNSAAMINMPEHAMDVVRPGIALYGVEPVAEKIIGLKPVMTLKAAIMQIRQVNQGESISYGATFFAERNMRIATLSIGYGDGLPRQLSNRGYASIHGQHLPIVGRICMDYCMVDLGEVKASEGDQVEFWGEQIMVNDVAKIAETISYELFTGIAARVPRVIDA